MPSTTLRTLTRRTFLAHPFRPVTTPTAFTARRNVGGYGDGEGDPKGEKPQKQGTSPATSDLEHPGPPPPDVGKDSGSTPTKASADKGHHGEEKGGSKGESAGKGESKSGGEQMDEGMTDRGPKNGAQPKLNTEPPKGQDSKEVREHNEEVKNRSGKIHEDGKGEKVEKGYWKGEFGWVSRGVDLLTLCLQARATIDGLWGLRRSGSFYQLLFTASLLECLTSL